MAKAEKRSTRQFIELNKFEVFEKTLHLQSAPDFMRQKILESLLLAISILVSYFDIAIIKTGGTKICQLKMQILNCHSWAINYEIFCIVKLVQIDFLLKTLGQLLLVLT